MTKILNEGLDYHDLEGQMDPTVTVDEYAAHMGKDSEIVTLAFVTHSDAAGNDLADWFERGYDYVLDAEVSEGEVSPGKYLVFVEMDRRSKVPERIISVLSDLETLTGLKLNDWTVEVGGESVDADEAALKNAIILNPNVYEEEKEVDKDLNEFRQLAGLESKPMVYEEDEYIKNLKAMAGM